MNDEGLDMWKMKDREEVAAKGELREDSGLPWVFKQFGEPALTTNPVRSFRTAGRKVGGGRSALALTHQPPAGTLIFRGPGVGDLARSPCDPRGVMLIVAVGIDNLPPRQNYASGPDIIFPRCLSAA